MNTVKAAIQLPDKESLLSHFTLENLFEAVFWVDAAGIIIHANDSAYRMTGYTKPELIGMKVVQLNDSPIVADFPKFWNRLKKERKIIFEAQHRHKNGYLYDVEISGNYIEIEGQEFSCSIVRNISQRRMEEQLFREVSEATSALTGHDFLFELTRKISNILGMKYVFIAECADLAKTRFRTIAFANGETILDNIEYDVKGSACEMVLKKEPYFLPSGTNRFFPLAVGIESYIGVPIISLTSGEMIGHIAASDPNPVTEEKNQTAILKIFAGRIGAELERMKAEDALEKKNEELNKRLNEIELYNSTIKNLQVQVFWLDKTGKFIRVNEAVSKQTGYTTEELNDMSVFHLNPSLTQKEWKIKWDETKKSRQQILETEHHNKDGSVYAVEVTNNFIEHDGKEYFCSSVRDIRKRKLEEELLRTVSESTSALTGEDYFREVAKFITATLNVRYSMVVSCSNEDGTKLRMLSYVDRQEILESFEYDTKGTPCEIVMQGKEFFCADKLEETFPREKRISSWLAVPIYSPSSGKVIGNIAAFDNVPMKNEKNQLAILRIFAARAGAEIERLKAEEKLKIANEQLKHLLDESEERFRDLFEEAPIAYVHEGLDSKFIKANRAALRILGLRPEDVPYTYGKKMAPDTPDAQRSMKEAFESVGRGTDTSGVVLELRRADNNQPIWIQWWSNPDPTGTFTRTMFIDITDKVMMEQQQAKLQAQNQYLREEIKLNNNFEEIVSKSKVFHKVLQQVEQVASTDATVLVLGESGTGKELISRAIHNVSNRSKKPFVKINCATLPANLIESELFGHERGAFTGALERKIGRFELADGGSIFLDEIGELPVELQAKLLRVLQEGEFERLGNPKTMKVNVRVIAATNRNLKLAIEKKEFREDLYYRLNVFPITSPPLRERKEDIPLLVKHFLQKYEGKMGKKINNVSSKVIDALMLYDWPGNIRELENLVERAMIISPGNTLEFGDWLPTTHITTTGKSTLHKLEDVEKEHILEILKKVNWKVSGEKGAAKILGLNPTTLEAKMKKLGIKRNSQ
jgi:formate hydrogenlyase transcriptional activator